MLAAGFPIHRAQLQFYGSILLREFAFAAFESFHSVKLLGICFLPTFQTLSEEHAAISFAEAKEIECMK